MNIDCFLKRFTDVLMNDKHDDTFETLKILTGGTTSTRICKLLSFAVSQMENDECYLEVGVFNGTSLCSAAYVSGKKCVGIDAYNPEYIKNMCGLDASMVRDRCLHNIRNCAPWASLIEKDFRTVTKEEIGSPVAVSFIDGKHEYDDVMENFAWLEPMLADEAILVFDDVNYEGVTRAISNWVAAHPSTYDLIFYAKPFYMDDKNSWSINERFLNNGTCVLRYHKDPKAVKWIVPVPEVSM